VHRVLAASLSTLAPGLEEREMLRRQNRVKGVGASEAVEESHHARCHLQRWVKSCPTVKLLLAIVMEP
jgi:hypothetical protein